MKILQYNYVIWFKGKKEIVVKTEIKNSKATIKTEQQKKKTNTGIYPGSVFKMETYIQPWHCLFSL